MLKILQLRLEQYVNLELPYIQDGFSKGRGARDQIANICWIIKKARQFQKNISFCFIDCAKAFDCVNHNKLWKILKEMGIPSRDTAGPNRPHLGLCPGPNVPLLGRQRSRHCILDSPGESGLVSRGSQGHRSPVKSRRVYLGAHCVA